MNLILLKDIAIQAALSAGKIIQESMNSEFLVEKKKAGSSYASQVLTDVDLACESVILAHLLPTCKKYYLALLSEESEDDGNRFKKDFFWCIDPMDGTLAFINNRPGFSVSIALVAKDGTPHIGVVFDPSTETMYYAIRGRGAYRNGQPWRIERKNNYLTYLTDRKLEDTPNSDEIVKLLNGYVDDLELEGFKEISGAGAVMNAIQVAENGPACMIKFPKKEIGGGSLWDFAATACMYHELGLSATNFIGKRLDLNKKEGTFMNHEGTFYRNI